MVDNDRRDMLKMTGGGLAGLGLAAIAAASASTDAVAAGAKVGVKGAMPMLPALGKMMPDGQGLMGALATEFAPRAAQMSTQKAYWLAFNAWLATRLCGPIVEGQVKLADIGEQAWVIHASGYWGGIEFRKNWGAPPVFSKPGMKIPVAAEIQAIIVGQMAKRLEVLKAGPEACLDYLPEILHDDSTTGTIYTIAYNSGCQVVKTEDPPLGQRRPHRPHMPGAVRIYARDFLRVDYDFPGLTTPDYLKVWRSNFEQAAAGNPQAYEKVLVGAAGQKDLRAIWKRGVEYGNFSWGGDANDHWEAPYYDETLYWALYMGLGIEAVALASMVAAINRDPQAAYRAVMGNTVLIGETFGWGIGMGDADGNLPIVA